MSRYLVTGCAGFIGSHLAGALVERGDEVLGIDAFTDFYARELKEENIGSLRRRPAFTFVEGDLADLDLPVLLDGVAGVYHLAAQPGVRGSWGDSFPVCLQHNLGATLRVFEAAAAAGVRVVFASSSSVYGQAAGFPASEDMPLRPLSPYGVTKLGCEHLARACAGNFGLEAVIVRYFTVYGPRQRPDMAFSRILAALLRGTPFNVNGTGMQSRDFTYVQDAVAGTIAAMERGPAGAIYNVGGGTEATLLEVIELCEKLTGRQLDVRRGPRAAGDVTRTAADTTRIRTDLDWAPVTALPDGLAAQLEDVSDLIPSSRACKAARR